MIARSSPAIECIIEAQACVSGRFMPAGIGPSASAQAGEAGRLVHQVGGGLAAVGGVTYTAEERAFDVGQGPAGQRRGTQDSDLPVVGVIAARRL